MSMEKGDIIIKVNDFLVDEFELEKNSLKADATWKEIGVDSLDFVDIVVIVEQTFGFKLKGEDMSSIKTLDMFYDHIESRLNNNA